MTRPIDVGGQLELIRDAKDEKPGHAHYISKAHMADTAGRILDECPEVRIARELLAALEALLSEIETDVGHSDASQATIKLARDTIAQARPDKTEASIPTWSCYTCGYAGDECVTTDDADTESCPKCGTFSGDGFGMAENDPYYTDDEEAAISKAEEGEKPRRSNPDLAAAASRCNPYSDRAGYMRGQRNEINHGWVVVYEAADQEMDVDGRWAVVCETHGALVGVSSVAKARPLLKVPKFCDECMKEVGLDNQVRR